MFEEDMVKKSDKKNIQKSWILSVCSKILGVVLIILPLLVFAAILDYDASDPSLNKVSTSNMPVNNFLGLFGAVAADAVLNSFGLGLIIFLLVPLFWGVGLLRYQEFPEYKTRIFAWFVGILSLSCFFDITCREYLGGLSSQYNLTGSWSRVLSRPINNYINMLNIPYNTVIMDSIVLFVSVISFNFSAGITFKRWIVWFSSVWKLLCTVFMLVVNFAKRLANVHNFREFKEINPRYLQNKTRNGLRGINVRREPAFESVKPQIQASAGSFGITSQNISENNVYNTAIASGSELTIEVPQSMTYSENVVEEVSDNSASLKKNSFSPTFDFINDDEIANQNVKKAIRKITPEDIYQPQNIGSQEPKSSVVPEQKELLEVPTHASNDIGSHHMAQRAITEEKVTTVSTSSKSEQYVLPDVNLLSAPKETSALVIDEEALKQRAMQLEHVLNDFNIHGQIVKVSPGPVVTLYELEPKSGTRTARVIGLSDDIARSMAVSSVRMAVVSGKSTIGIELPNEKRQTVWLRELLEDNEFMDSKNILNVALGKDIGGRHMYADISKMPHLLVAGTTGSGKSVGVNSMILSLLYRMTPDQCKFIMIDPKQLEFSMYNGIPHLLTPVITDPAKAVVGLKWAVHEMEERYRAMSMLNVRNIAGYNKKVAELNKSGKEIKKTIQTGFDKETNLPIYEEQVVDTSPMPYIVIVVDEMADLMLVAGKEVEAAIQRLAQMARAAGIHLIMSTQRPSVDVITGVIKANFPSRLSFHVTTRGDSITILGEKGAEQLLGMGDMLYMPSGLRPLRIHGCFVPDEEVERIVEFIKSQGEPEYVEEVTAGELKSADSGPVFDKGEMAGGDAEEELYMQAVEIVRNDKKASTSYVQRKLRIGYNRAANLIERMEREGVVSKQDHVGRREVIGVD